MLSEDPDWGRLLDLAYDAATEPELWSSVLTEIADLLGADCGALFGVVTGRRQLDFAFNGRCDPAYNEVLRTRHMQNPWAISMQTRAVGEIVFSDEIIDLASIRPTAFFDEMLHSQNLAHNAMVALAGKGGFQVAFNILRDPGQGPYGKEQRAILARLVPHLCRSVHFGFRLEAYRALQQSAFAVLDSLSVGIALLDRRQAVIYVNGAAREIAADGSLVLRNAQLSHASPPHAQRLAELVGAATLGTPAGSMSVPDANGERMLTLLVFSIRGKDIGRFADNDLPDAAVLVFLIDPARAGTIPTDWIVSAYGLTRAEARVAIAVSSGMTVHAAARQLGLSQNTVKTHLGRVFAKTGTSRQSELARIIATIGLLRTP